MPHAAFHLLARHRDAHVRVCLWARCRFFELSAPVALALDAKLSLRLRLPLALLLCLLAAVWVLLTRPMLPDISSPFA